MKGKKRAERLLAWLFWAGVFLWFLNPLKLGDVFWHLRAGEWILQHRALPQEDPFGLSSRDGQFVLKANWAAQVLLYLSYKLGGLRAVVFFKALVFTGMFLLLERLLRAQGLQRPLSLLALLPSLLVLHFYDEARPQAFSFLGFVLLLHALQLRRPWLLPPLLLVWANMHGGYVLGVAFLLAYVLREALPGGARLLLGGGQARHKGLLLLGPLAALLSGANPLGWEAFRATWGLFAASVAGRAGIHEHLGLREFAAFTGQWQPLWLVLALGGLALGSFLLGRKGPLLAVLTLGLLWASLESFRAGAFLALLAPVLLAKNLARLRVPRPAWAALALVLALSAWPVLRQSLLRAPLVPEIVPAKAAEFILRAQAPPNIFHPYEWGGYFIWRLWPRYKVFISGRALGPTGDYQHILQARPGYTLLLDKYDINTVASWSLLPYKGRVPPLVYALLKDEDWALVHWDLRSLVFIRAPLAKKALKKGTGWMLLESSLRQNALGEPRSPHRWAALAELYIHMGKPSLALEALRKTLALAPSHPLGLRLLQEIKLKKSATSP
jgi:hypothetical protein